MYTISKQDNFQSIELKSGWYKKDVPMYTQITAYTDCRSNSTKMFAQ